VATENNIRRLRVCGDQGGLEWQQADANHAVDTLAGPV
jgi:hypothetical protein